MWAERMQQKIYAKFDECVAGYGQYKTVEFMEHRLFECMSDWELSLERLTRRQEDLLELADALLLAAIPTPQGA